LQFTYKMLLSVRMPKSSSPAIKYLILDSNQLIKFFENWFLISKNEGEFKDAGENLETLEAFATLIKKGKVQLILSEAVVHEYRRIKKEKLEELGKTYDFYISKIKGDSPATTGAKLKLPNSVVREIVGKLSEKLADAQGEIQKSGDIIESILNNKETTPIINLDSDILIRAYRRGLKSLKPFDMHVNPKKDDKGRYIPIYDIQPDCIIIESAIVFLQSKKGYELFICTDDSDYFTNYEKNEIHSDIKKDLNINSSYTSISAFLNEVFGHSFKIPESKELESIPAASEPPPEDEGAADTGVVSSDQSKRRGES